MRYGGDAEVWRRLKWHGFLSRARNQCEPATTFVVPNNEKDVKFDFHYTTQRPARPQ